jgi:hypothetical protein
MSSIRTNQRPSFFLASRKEIRAANRDPKCRGPVGEGAKRPRYELIRKVVE